MTDTMTCIEISEPGGPEVLKPATRPVPVPGHGQILIRVAYAGVNRPDALQRAGNYAPPPGASDLPGLEASGTVAALGPGVTEWQVGDAVCALLPGGGYAEYVVTPPHTHCVSRGDINGVSGLPAGDLFHRLDQRLHAGRAAGRRTVSGAWRVVGHRHHRDPAGAGLWGAGLCHRGLGREMRGLHRSGRGTAINYKDEDFVAAMRAEGGANLILDMVGGSYIPRNVKALVNDGRLVQIAFLSGPKAELNFAEVMVRRLTITGSTLRPQSDLAKARIAEALGRDVWPLLEAGRVAPVMDSRFPLEQADAAHARMESSAHIGKIVLEVGGSD